MSDSSHSIRDVCRGLDLTESAVRRWIEQAEVDRGRTERVTSTEREEPERLRRENGSLSEERGALDKGPTPCS